MLSRSSVGFSLGVVLLAISLSFIAAAAKAPVLKWTAQTPGGVVNKGAYLGDRVVFCSWGRGDAGGLVTAFAVSTGKALWHTETPVRCGDHPVAVPSRNMIIVSTLASYTYQGFVTALNATDGTVLWQSHSSGSIYSAPAFSSKHSSLIFGTHTSAIRSVSVDNGTVLWNYDISANVNGPCALQDEADLVFCLTTDANLYALQTTTGTRQWRHAISYNTMNGEFTGPSYSNGIVVASGPYGSLTAFRSRTGEKLWKADSFSGFSQPSVVNDQVFVGNSESGFFSFNASTGVSIWNATWITAQVLGGAAILAREHSVLFATCEYPTSLFSLDTRSGALRWQWNCTTTNITSCDQFYASPLLVEEVGFTGIFIGTEGGLIIGLELE
jgi:outer membrane protein assembly factor BamB